MSALLKNISMNPVDRGVTRQLYKWSLDGPYLKFLTHQQGRYVLAELHDGVCGNHLGGKTLAHRAYT